MRTKRQKVKRRKAGMMIFLLAAAWLWVRNDGNIPAFDIDNIVDWEKGQELIIALIFVTGLTLFARPAGGLLKKYIRRKKYLHSSLAQIDNMDGHEFEEYLAAHFQKLGYRVENVGTGGHDYGVDLILKKNGNITAVQAKRYNGSVGIKAVQEIMSGMVYYGADSAMVVTNSKFTASAQELASRGNVELWDREYCRKHFKVD